MSLNPLTASFTVNTVAIGVEVLAEQVVKQLALLGIGDSQYEIALSLLALIRFHNSPICIAPPYLILGP